MYLIQLDNAQFDFVGLHGEWKMPCCEERPLRYLSHWLVFLLSFSLEYWQRTLCNAGLVNPLLLFDLPRYLSLYLALFEGIHDSPSCVGTWLGHYDSYQDGRHHDLARCRKSLVHSVSFCHLWIVSSFQ